MTVDQKIDKIVELLDLVTNVGVVFTNTDTGQQYAALTNKIEDKDTFSALIKELKEANVNSN